MKIVLPNATIDYVCGPSNDNSPKALIHGLANNGRTCTGVSDPNDYEKDCKMIANLLEKEHGGALEFIDFHMTFTVSRDIEMELVRHRMASWLWSSTRYINYTKKFGIEYILPSEYIGNPAHTSLLDTHTERMSLQKDGEIIYPRNEFNVELGGEVMWNIKDANTRNPIYLTMDLGDWIGSKINCELMYIDSIKSGKTPESARGYLSGDMKAIGKCKMNMRELLHFLKLRMDPHSHPDMVHVACMIGRQFNEMFKDIPYEFEHTQYLS